MYNAATYLTSVCHNVRWLNLFERTEKYVIIKPFRLLFQRLFILILFLFFFISGSPFYSFAFRSENCTLLFTIWTFLLVVVLSLTYSTIVPNVLMRYRGTNAGKTPAHTTNIYICIYISTHLIFVNNGWGNLLPANKQHVGFSLFSLSLSLSLLLPPSLAYQLWIRLSVPCRKRENGANDKSEISTFSFFSIDHIFPSVVFIVIKGSNQHDMTLFALFLLSILILAFRIAVTHTHTYKTTVTSIWFI